MILGNCTAGDPLASLAPATTAARKLLPKIGATPPLAGGSTRRPFGFWQIP